VAPLRRLEARGVITDVPGVVAGHWTDEQALTGCTAVLFPEGTRASGEVRGGAPATREWELLAPERTVDRIDAMMLCGGSAFGLAACDGAMRFCEEAGRGVATPAGVVPIVVGAAIFDLAVGEARVRPGAAEGYAACAAAESGAPLVTGRVGAGAGATVGKWLAEPRPAGLGAATMRDGELVVAALAVVNAWGDAYDPASPPPAAATPPPFAVESTTLAVVATNATLTKTDCLLVARSGHAGMARALEPAHTAFDGDAVLAAATGALTADTERVRLLAARAVEAAVREPLR
jgi:L-aminopeptidase/D-esterase-like protein